MQSLRHQRVRELLKRQLGEILRREYPIDKVGVININDIALGSDLKSATVYVGIVGSTAQQAEAWKILHSDRKRIQTLLAGSVILKYMPYLKFESDESISRGNRVLKIIEDLQLPDDHEHED